MHSEESKVVIELETKIAYLEDMVDSLNEVICEHGERVNRLEQICKHLHDKLETVNDLAQSSQDGQGNQTAHEIPPHY
ncbi:MAG: SlyX family protein [Pseudomonadales bacterium]|nr:SlyX family protein [Pseudomonadales bacterium]